VYNFQIQSHSGIYNVDFDHNLLDQKKINTIGTHYIIDKNVLPLLGNEFYSEVTEQKIVLIDANEETKSYQGVEPIITSLIEKNLKRDSTLVAIGGGITQDITCFIANTFMRGVNWCFIPTTLLAQADSCIGSKSSINFGKYKNLLGSFTPPNKVIICDQFLTTLSDKDIKSGIGEIIKLFLIDGKLITSEDIKKDLNFYLYQALQIKKRFIEEDEFDKGIRNILNYGHCFGHAIESSTNFEIPHGIAVSIGMDVANQFSYQENLITESQLSKMREILLTNYKEYTNVPINVADVFSALLKDKKNTGTKINLVLPVGTKILKRGFENTNLFWSKIQTALESTPITVR